MQEQKNSHFPMPPETEGADTRTPVLPQEAAPPTTTDLPERQPGENDAAYGSRLRKHLDDQMLGRFPGLMAPKPAEKPEPGSSGTVVAMSAGFAAGAVGVAFGSGVAAVGGAYLTLCILALLGRYLMKDADITRAASSGDTKVLGRYLEAGGDPNLQDTFGNSLLVMASYYGHEKAVDLLLAHQDTNVNHRGWAEGKTALHCAAERGHERIARRLLAHPDIDVNRRNDRKATALHYAADEGHLAIVRQLIEHPDCDVNARIHDGDTALHLAINEGHTACVRELSQHPKVMLEAAGSNNRTPMDRAKRRNRTDCADIIAKAIEDQKFEEQLAERRKLSKAHIPDTPSPRPR